MNFLFTLNYGSDKDFHPRGTGVCKALVCNFGHFRFAWIMRIVIDWHPKRSEEHIFSVEIAKSPISLFFLPGVIFLWQKARLKTFSMCEKWEMVSLVKFWSGPPPPCRMPWRITLGLGADCSNDQKNYRAQTCDPKEECKFLIGPQDWHGTNLT